MEAGAAGVKPRFTKDLVNGGTHYIETDGNPETRPGFWLKGNYLAWSSDRGLDFGGAAGLDTTLPIGVSIGGVVLIVPVLMALLRGAAGRLGCEPSRGRGPGSTPERRSSRTRAHDHLILTRVCPAGSRFEPELAS